MPEALPRTLRHWEIARIEFTTDGCRIQYCMGHTLQTMPDVFIDINTAYLRKEPDA
jgi:hypothetical protein